MNDIPPSTCPRCGTELLPGPSGGVCPRCASDLLQGTQTAVTGEPGAAAPFTPPSVAEIAEKFPQLEIISLIGKGGMGAVYKARQPQLDRIVALKILPPGIAGEGDDAAFAERFAREARALAKLSHPNIVTIHDFGQTTGPGGLYYLLMEYVDGITLRRLLETRRVAPREALAIVPEICDALQFAHDHGIVHRDIKPENILLDRRGRVKVADFGLAKLIGADADIIRAAIASVDGPALTEAGKIMGTPQYMAPEQRDHPGEVDHRADIYALGVVFYQMLTGELPGKRIEAPSKKVRIDIRLDEIVLRALEKEPDLRYQQASIFKTQVETIANTAGKTSHGEPPARNIPGNPAQLPASAQPAVSPGIPFLAKLSLGLLLLGLLGTPLLFVLAPNYSQNAIDVFAAASLLLAVIFGLVSRSRLGYGVAVGCITIFISFGAWVRYRHWQIDNHYAEMDVKFSREGQQEIDAAKKRADDAVLRSQAPQSAFTSSGTLPQGTLSLAGVSRDPADGAPGWWPDGSPVAKVPFDEAKSQPAPADPNQAAMLFAFRAADIPSDASGLQWQLQWHQDDAAGVPEGGSSGTLPAQAQPWYFVPASVPKSAHTVDIKAGFSMGAWETIALHDSAGNSGAGNFSTNGAWGQNWNYSFITPAENADKSAVFTVAYDVFDRDNNLHVDSPAETRMIAVDDKGEEHTGNYDRSNPAGALPFRLTATFSGLPLKRIVTVRFEGRPWHWIEFHNVALNPDTAATMQVMRSQLDADRRNLEEWRQAGIPDTDPKVAPIANDAQLLALQIKELEDHPGESLELLQAKADFRRLRDAGTADDDPKFVALFQKIKDLEQKRGWLPPIPAARYSYTPAIDRVVKLWIGPHDVGGFNLETGEFIKYTASKPGGKPEEDREWQKQFNIGLVNPDSSLPCLVGGPILEMDESAWDKNPLTLILDIALHEAAYQQTLAWDEGFAKYKSLAELADGIGLLPPDPDKIEYPNKPGKNVTYLFRTRDGRLGLFQNSYGPNSYEMEIRWKLIQDATAPAQPQAFTASGALPPGMFSLVAISRVPSDGTPPWAPDGSPAKDGLFDSGGISGNFSNANKEVREFVFHVRGLPRDIPQIQLRFDPPADETESGVSADDYYFCRASLPKSARTVNIKAAVAMGPWGTIAEGKNFRGGSEISTKRIGNLDWSISFPAPVEKADKSTVISVSYNAVDTAARAPIGPFDQQVRIIAVDDKGVEHTAGNPQGITSGGISQVTAIFPDLPAASIAKILFQARPYTWLEFNNVSLNPAGGTTAATPPPTATEQYAGQVVLTVKDDGTLIFDHKVISPDDLKTKLTRLAAANPGQAVILRADEKVDYKHIARALDICSAAKIWNVAFGTASETIDTPESAPVAPSTSAPQPGMTIIIDASNLYTIGREHLDATTLNIRLKDLAKQGMTKPSPSGSKIPAIKGSSNWR